MKRIIYSQIDGTGRGFYGLFAFLGAVVLGAAFSVYNMEHAGHWITGMSNQVIWGTPHVFAIFLIVAASGALNVASIGSVFGKKIYKPLGRLSGLVALALLLGGLAVLVLDLGRPDRLIVAMTKYNFTSIFAWNIILYVGFMVIVAAYLWVQMERRMNIYAKYAGLVAFIWRLILTTGTGSILGFIVAREAFDSAVLAPLFITMSFSFGLAVFSLILITAARGDGRALGDAVLERMGKLLGVFVAGVLYLTAVQHLTNLYMAKRVGIESFILLDGGIYTQLFWGGQVILGGLLPLAIVYSTVIKNAAVRLAAASVLVIAGGFAQIYVLLIGGQVYPQTLFPGKEVSSSLFDGVVAEYAPSGWEVSLGLGGVALALLIVMVGIKFLSFLPQSMADEDMDPHHKASGA